MRICSVETLNVDFTSARSCHYHKPSSVNLFCLKNKMSEPSQSNEHDLSTTSPEQSMSDQDGANATLTIAQGWLNIKAALEVKTMPENTDSVRLNALVCGYLADILRLEQIFFSAMSAESVSWSLNKKDWILTRVNLTAWFDENGKLKDVSRHTPDDFRLFGEELTGFRFDGGELLEIWLGGED